jgi:pyruvate/2-oxoglutarate dehydrogenase complex dihydrolipoamide dehydrogenase (E3) component
VGGVDGVAAVVIAPVVSDGSERQIDCDAVLLGVGTVPVIELLDAVGCRMSYVPERGGHVPVLDGTQQTSVAWLYAAGDCAGIWAGKTQDPEIARAEGRRAAAAAATSLGLVNAPSAQPPTPDGPAYDIDAYQLDWVRAAVVVYVCQCEEVTAREIGATHARSPRC